jgi:hypothetical protein
MSNPSRLLPVPFVLHVLGKGLVATVHFPLLSRARIRPGMPIVFVRPDGKALRTTVRGISLVKDGPDGRLIGVVLPDNVRKGDLPPGTMMQPPELPSTGVV